MMDKPKVVIFEQNYYFREVLTSTLTSCLDLELVGISSSAEGCLELVKSLTPDLVLLDLVPPEESGLNLIRTIKQSFPQTRVLPISTLEDEGTITKASGNGADGYYFKTCGPQEMLHAIRAVMSGQRFISR